MPTSIEHGRSAFLQEQLFDGHMKEGQDLVVGGPIQRHVDRAGRLDEVLIFCGLDSLRAYSGVGSGRRGD